MTAGSGSVRPFTVRDTTGALPLECVAEVYGEDPGSDPEEAVQSGALGKQAASRPPVRPPVEPLAVPVPGRRPLTANDRFRNAWPDPGKRG